MVECKWTLAFSELISFACKANKWRATLTLREIPFLSYSLSEEKRSSLQPFVWICKWKMTSIALQPMHYFIIQNTAVMAWWSQQVSTQLPGFLNRFVRRMIQCFHKGEAASVSLTVISPSLPAFVLMSSFYIHCKLITFLNHHQAHGSLLWLLFILDCKMDCVFFIYIFMCFLSFLLPSCLLLSCGFW